MAQEMMFYPREKTPQTVPVGDYTSDVFASYADIFDLSLLPSDCEVPLSPQSQQLQSMVPSAASLSPEYIPATIFHDSPMQQALQHMKQEKYWNDSASSPSSTSSSVLLEQLQAGPQYQYYTTPVLSPQQQQQEQYIVLPPSPCPSLQDLQSPKSNQSQNTNLLTIKQEYCFLPPSPPDSNGAPSPIHCGEIKTEFDSSAYESAIDIDSLLNNSFDDHSQEDLNKDSKSFQDHQLLREYLQDTSFQRKHNLKPLALESLLGGWTTRGDIEPVISLALEHARRDVQATCAALDISLDPQQWSSKQVQQWLESTLNQFKLSAVPEMATLFPEDGEQLTLLSEDEFMCRMPQAGSILHAQLEVWKAACYDTPMQTGATNAAVATAATPTSVWSPETESVNGDISEDEDEEMPSESTTSLPSTSTTTATSTTPAAHATTAPVPKTRQGGSHIHLWQFLKELLASPQTHGTAIRWLDRNKGVFKIEDSVRVARLWGRRKNRPAMNYDKLSRSIRQYYKKGIMKKTERSQRLVYQFCHPYCL